jgi:hypothetical protein
LLHPFALLVRLHGADGEHLGTGHLASRPGEADGHFAQSEAVELAQDDADLSFNVGLVREVPVLAKLQAVGNLRHGANKPG